MRLGLFLSNHCQNSGNFLWNVFKKFEVSPVQPGCIISRFSINHFLWVNHISNEGLNFGVDLSLINHYFVRQPIYISLAGCGISINHFF